MEQKNEKKSVWGVLLKVIIAVASAIAGALGISACSLWRRDVSIRIIGRYAS